MSDTTDIQRRIVTIDDHRFGAIHKHSKRPGYMRACLNRGCMAIVTISGGGEVTYNESECPLKKEK